MESNQERILMRNLFINVRLQHEGFHHWAEAPEPKLSFLRSRHRHIFHFDIEIAVNHDNRDTEFIIVKQAVSEWLTATYDTEFGSMSCEAIAIATDERLRKLGYFVRRIMVSEDGENGGGLVYE